jgi:hypothetical protein
MASWKDAEEITIHPSHPTRCKTRSTNANVVEKSLQRGLGTDRICSHGWMPEMKVSKNSSVLNYHQCRTT